MSVLIYITIHIQARARATKFTTTGISSGVRTLALEARGPTFESSISENLRCNRAAMHCIADSIRVLEQPDQRVKNGKSKCAVATIMVILASTLPDSRAVRQPALNRWIARSNRALAELCVSSMWLRPRNVNPKKRVRISSCTPCARSKESNASDCKPEKRPCKSARALQACVTQPAEVNGSNPSQCEFESRGKHHIIPNFLPRLRNPTGRGKRLKPVSVRVRISRQAPSIYSTKEVIGSKTNKRQCE